MKRVYTWAEDNSSQNAHYKSRDNCSCNNERRGRESFSGFRVVYASLVNRWRSDASVNRIVAVPRVYSIILEREARIQGIVSRRPLLQFEAENARVKCSCDPDNS